MLPSKRSSLYRSILFDRNVRSRLYTYLYVYVHREKEASFYIHEMFLYLNNRDGVIVVACGVTRTVRMILNLRSLLLFSVNSDEMLIK